MLGYLVFMGVRLIECKRILKETGSIYLHCDHSANVYLRLLMNGIFGEENFRNEIIWHYENKLRDKRKRVWQNATDTILYYTKTANYTFNPPYEKLAKPKKYARIKKVDGVKVTVKDASGKTQYMFSEKKLVDNVLCIPMITGSKERTGWATQKPIALYSRIILASTNPGDVVFDPFCGCATTLVAAENAGRQCIGIDRHPEAEKQVVQQLNKLNNGTETETQDELGKDWGRRVIIINTYEKDKNGKVKKDKNGKFISLKQLPIARTDLAATIPYKKHFNDLYTNQNGMCNGCGRHVDKHIAHIDHKVPRTKGGQDHFGNLQILCSGCNTLKGNRTMAWLMKTLKERGLMVNQSNAY